MKATIAIAAALLAGCATHAKRPEALPAAKVIEVQVPTFVPIDHELLLKCDWTRNVKLSQSPTALRQRAACLLQYEDQLDAIGTVQGKPVP